MGPVTTTTTSNTSENATKILLLPTRRGRWCRSDFIGSPAHRGCGFLRQIRKLTCCCLATGGMGGICRARDLPAEAEVPAGGRESRKWWWSLGVEMAALAPLPPLPPQFKSIQHHLRTAQEHDKRDPVVAYYCEFSRLAAASPASRGPHSPPFGAGGRPRLLALALIPNGGTLLPRGSRPLPASPQHRGVSAASPRLF